MSRRNGSSLPSKQKSPDEIERAVTSEKKKVSAAWERCEALDDLNRLLTSQLFSHLHALFDSISLNSLNDDKFLE